MSANQELVMIVDEHNQPVGAANRSEMRARGFIHRAAYILIFNSGKELFVHRRTRHKDIYPGYYCVTVGGVVLADEPYSTAAARELAEEVGIHQISLDPCFDFFHQDQNNRLWGRAYSCEWDGEMVLQPEELESGSFVPIPRVLKDIKSLPFTPDGAYVLRRYLARNPSPNTPKGTNP